MLDADAPWLIQDPATGDYVHAASARTVPRIEIACTRCGTVFAGSLFQAARDGHFEHKCKPPPRRHGRFTIW